MRLARAAQLSFTSGEIAESLYGRIDVSRYFSGAALMRNVLVRPQGGFRRRPGMAHVEQLTGGEGLDGTRLLPFAFNTEQTYCIVLTAHQMRVYRSDGLFLAVVGELPWDGTMASQMNHAQSADTLLLFHPGMRPQRIRRGTSETEWTVDDVPWTNIPTLNWGVVTPVGTVTPSATTGDVILTASDSVFLEDHYLWEWRDGTGRVRITQIVSGTEATGRVIAELAGTDPINPDTWTLTEPIMSPTRGWPECGTFHQARLWIGGFGSKPATFIASVVGDYFNLEMGTNLDDQAIVATIDTDQVNAIHQIVSARGLQMFTSGAEHVITGDPLTPSTIGREEQTRRGIKRFVRTCEVDGATLFVQRQGAALRQFVYVETEQAWRSDIASLLAPHLILDPIDLTARKTARQDDADIILLVNPGGTVTVLTTLRSQEVTAFTRWETDGQVLAVTALLSGEVFFAVLRDGTVRIETWAETRLLDASSRRVEATTPFRVMYGLRHLEGQQVAVVADGAYLGLFTVSGWSVTLPRTAYDVEVGLPPEVAMTPLPLEPRDQSGNLIGRRSRVTEVTVRALDSGTFTVNGQPLVLRGVGRAPNQPLDSAPPIRSGDFTLRGLQGWKERHQLVIEQPNPGPLEVLALTYEMRLGE